MKGLAFSAKWLKFLTWPGLACATAGLVAGSLSGWQVLPTALLILGIGLLLLGFSFSGQTAGAFWQQRSTQAGTNAVVATLAVLVILGLVNFLAVQHTTRFDLTETKLFTLAPATKTVVQSLEKPVRVVIFSQAQNPQDVQLLESYRLESANFDFEYVDPVANPTLAESFGVSQPGMVFLEVESDRRFLQTLGSVPNPQTPDALETLSERQLTNALAQVVSDRTLSVYFIQGHGEPPIDGSAPGFAQAAASLSDRRYQVAPLNLTEVQAVPEDADVVVVAGPVQDFFIAEVDALVDFLNSGGGLLLLLDPRSEAGLNPLLDDWGVILDDRLVLDTSGAGQFVGLGPAAPIISDYGDHPITQEFGDGRSFYPIARPVESRELPDIEATPLLLTDAQSRAEAISDEGDLSFDPSAPPTGPHVLGVALSRTAQAPDLVSIEPEADTDEAEAEAEANAEAANADEAGADANATEPDTDESEAANAVTDDTSVAAVADGSDTDEAGIANADAEAGSESAAEPEDGSAAELGESEPDSADAATDTATVEEPVSLDDAASEPESGDAASENAAEPGESEPDSADAAADTATAEEADGDAAIDSDEAVDADEAIDVDRTDEAPPTEPGESRLVVIGNSTFAVDGSFNQQLNGDVFLNSVNWLGQEADATLSIQPKTVTDRRMQMTGQQAWGLGIFSLLVLPLTGLALAIVMALRRR
ncbi:MAG: Gldg family protein [Cyanobacteria bacterium P01_D01_bin.71]